MNKELKALEKIEDFLVNIYDDYGIKHTECLNTRNYIRHSFNINVIEAALKRKEQQDNALKVLKEVIEFATISPHVEPNKDNGFNIMSDVGISIQRDIENKERELLRQWVLETCFPKELKALEIIKESVGIKISVDEDLGCLYVPITKCFQPLEQNIVIVGYVKGKEKIDLLKEVLL